MAERTRGTRQKKKIHRRGGMRENGGKVWKEKREKGVSLPDFPAICQDVCPSVRLSLCPGVRVSACPFVVCILFLCFACQDKNFMFGSFSFSSLLLGL